MLSFGAFWTAKEWPTQAPLIHPTPTPGRVISTGLLHSMFYAVSVIHSPAVNTVSVISVSVSVASMFSVVCSLRALRSLFTVTGFLGAVNYPE
jgi:hypothetical protein